jgi:Uma2 family endonuclease
VPELRGWRYRRVQRPDGSEELEQVFLTADDFMNPQEGDIMPEDTFHSETVRLLCNFLIRYLARRKPALKVFADLVIRWTPYRLPNSAPDVCVIPNVQDSARRRRSFDVGDEGTQPILVIEVVSEEYRKEDRDQKVRRYEQAQVAEYVIFDQRRERGRYVDEVIGYRLEEGRYRPLIPNEDGVILCKTVGLWLGMENGRPFALDMETGERLLTDAELEARAEAEAQRAEAEAKARAEAEARLAALEAELKRLRGEG